MTGKHSPDRLNYRFPWDHHLYSHGRETPEAMWERKAKEAKSSRLTSSIKKKGVQKPVKMMEFMSGHILADGHHRVAAAHSLDPNTLVPVEHY